MCNPYSLPLWSLFWVQCYLLGLATATASKLSAAVPPLPCNLRSPSLIKLHVRMLRLNPNAGKPQPYVMRGCRLKLVPPSSEAS